MKKRVITAAVLLMLMPGMTACSGFEFSTFKYYSEVRKDAYSDRGDIDPEDHGIYIKTVAGFLNCLDDRDEDGIEDFCCERLLDMEGTDELIDALVDGFEGDIIDTSPLATDLAARKYGQWSADEPVAFYDSDLIVYTDEQTYWMSISLYSVCDNTPDGDEFVGINRIRMMTLDRRYGMEILDPEEDGEIVIDRYSFRDGTIGEMLLDESCGILVSYGDSSDYIAVNTAKGSSFNVFMLTGSDDGIRRSVIDRIDFTDEEEAYETITSYEPYAMGEPSSVSNVISHYWLYSIEGSDEKLLVHFSGSDEDDIRISYVRILDITKLVTEQREQIVYDD